MLCSAAKNKLKFFERFMLKKPRKLRSIWAGPGEGPPPPLTPGPWEASALPPSPCPSSHQALFPIRLTDPFRSEPPAGGQAERSLLTIC